MAQVLGKHGSILADYSFAPVRDKSHDHESFGVHTLVVYNSAMESLIEDGIHVISFTGYLWQCMDMYPNFFSLPESCYVAEEIDGRNKVSTIVSKIISKRNN